MKQEKQKISADDRAVSPVIGVILMVAITVILAAVIGTFVLGLGQNLNQAPQGQISIDAAGNAGSITISHNGGDAIPATELVVRTSSDSGSDTVNFEDQYGSSEFSVGDEATITSLTQDSQLTVRLVHEPSESIIAESTVDTT